MAPEAETVDTRNEEWEAEVLDHLLAAGELLDRHGQRELANLAGQLYQQVGYQVIGVAEDENE